MRTGNSWDMIQHFDPDNGCDMRAIESPEQLSNPLQLESQMKARKTEKPDGSASSHCSSSLTELDRETALRHKRGFEALRQSSRDLADTPEMNTPEQMRAYLATVPADLRPKIKAIFDDIASR